MTRTRRKIHYPRLGLAVGLVATLAACASLPPPIQLMDRAQSEVRAARAAGAVTSAPEAYAEAERRLAAAQQFSTNGDNGNATDKAQEAEAAAATARAQADLAKLDQQIAQQTSVNANLQADLERRQAAAAAAQAAVAAPPASASSASASSASGNAPVNLPSIELGQPATPASAASAAMPPPASTSGNPDSGVQP
ncbi:MAG: DUF4398 domain-containing protein [Rhodanobacteraceae bacterium]